MEGYPSGPASGKMDIPPGTCCADVFTGLTLVVSSTLGLSVRWFVRMHVRLLCVYECVCTSTSVCLHGCCGPRGGRPCLGAWWPTVHEGSSCLLQPPARRPGPLSVASCWPLPQLWEGQGLTLWPGELLGVAPQSRSQTKQEVHPLLPGGGSHIGSGLWSTCGPLTKGCFPGEAEALNWFLSPHPAP